MVLEAAVLTILPGAVAFAAAMDIFTMTIPNRISIVLVLAFFPLALLAGLSFSDIAAHVGAGVLMLLVGFALFAFGVFGGGDAKLMAAVGLWVGFDCLPLYLLSVALAGGFIAGAFATIRSVPLPRFLLGPGVGTAAAPAGRRHSLRHRAGGRCADGVSADHLVRAPRRLVSAPGET